MDTRIKEILSYMPDNLKCMLMGALNNQSSVVQEIRLRANRPLILGTLNGSFAVMPDGKLSPAVGGAYITTKADINSVFRFICENSVYAYLEDIRQGFITIKGGHRAGFTGKAVCGDKSIENLKDISSINIRIAREVVGCANGIIDEILKYNKITNTLFISPPLGGKTTVIRDVARQISDKGFKVAIADDRGEIASMYKGVPENDIGIMTDVIENAPKKDAVSMLLRSMSPEVIISDEISNFDDACAVEQCFGTGVSVIGSAHGKSLSEIKGRKFLRPLIGKGGFEKVIILTSEGCGITKNIKGTCFDTSALER